VDAFRPVVAPEVAQALQLVVSELVTNAVLHSASAPNASVHLDVELQNRILRVEVIDEGTGFVGADEVRPGGDHHGRGLLIVAKLAARWGIDSGRRTKVWAELPASAAWD
jgi:serine/threonine-protein kinase RsbW